MQQGGTTSGSEAVVTWEDQQNINKFGRFNNRLHDLEDEIKAAKEPLQNLLVSMEAQQLLNADSTRVAVKATIQLGSETYFAQANEGLISDQLVSVKEQSMSILKDFITKHNIPNDVPDEPEEFSSSEEDVDDMSAKPQVKKSKKLQ